MADFVSKYTGPQIDEAVGKSLNGGTNGKDGVSPTVTVSKSGKVTTLTITDKEGTKTATISDGADGKTPVKGTDYWTAADKAEIEAYIDAALEKANGGDGRTNHILSSINADGSPYNSGTGYKEGYRLNSSAVEKELAGAVVSGYIPYNGEDIEIRVPSTEATGTANYLHLFRSDFSWIQYAYDGSTIDGSMRQFYNWATYDGVVRKYESAAGTQTIFIPKELVHSDTTFIRVSAHAAVAVNSDTFDLALNESVDDKADTGDDDTGDEDSNADNTVPSYWLPELNAKADAIQTAMEAAGRNKSAFLWYTDAHWPHSAKVSPALLGYLIQNTPMNKINFGGDIVGDPNPHTHDNIKYVYEWRKMIAGLPNHHSVPGNHDLNHNSTDVRDMAYAFLIAPEESPDMVMGGDLYYYIDNPAEKTRYLYLDYMTSDHTAMVAQGQFVVDAIKGVQDGWHIVVIAHRWFQYTSSSTPTVGSVPNYEKEILSVFDAYNAKTSRAVSNYFGALDFADAKGKVEFCIGGHIHCDHDFNSDGGIPVIITAPDTNQERSNETEDSGTVGTTSESAVFGIIADYNDADSTKITVIGVGRGTSRIVTADSSTVVDPSTPATPTEMLTLDREYVNGAVGEQLVANLSADVAYLNVAYDQTDPLFIDKSCTVTDVTENSVTLTEPGRGGTVVAYPLYLPDISTQSYKITFDYSGAGKCRTYYRYVWKSGSISSINTLYADETTGASGSANVTIPTCADGEWLILMFGTNTGQTKSFTNVTFEKA